MIIINSLTSPYNDPTNVGSALAMSLDKWLVLQVNFVKYKMYTEPVCIFLPLSNWMPGTEQSG